MKDATQRLLIIGCSQRKRSDPGLLAGIERYDGPAFRVLRKFGREFPESMPEVYILSAEFGLIPSGKPIPDYDTRMDRERAKDLEPDSRKQFGQLFSSHQESEIAVCMGKAYRSLLPEFQKVNEDGASLVLLEGGLGKRLSALKGWLMGNARSKSRG